MTATETEYSFEFAKLPAELRAEICGYVKPNGWWQEYTIESLRGPVKRLSSKRRTLPPLFLVAKWILLEAVSSLTKSTCKIYVSSSKVGLNFPLEGVLKTDKVSCHLPPCKTISITIEHPDRMFEDFLQTRRNMAEMVQWLNSCDQKGLPNLQVKLDFGPDGTGVKPLPNEFMMGIGPLKRLSKPYGSVAISRDTGGYSYDARIDEQCGGVKRILTGCSTEREKGMLEFQQAMLNIRLNAVYLIERIRQHQVEHKLRVREAKWEADWTHKEPRQIERIPFQIDSCSVDDMSNGVNTLRDWFANTEIDAPMWLHSLSLVLNSQQINEEETTILFDELLRPGNTTSYEHWAVGLSTAFNPFQLAESESA